MDRNSARRAPHPAALTFGIAGLALVVTGAVRLTADFADIPGNVAVDALEAARPLSSDQVRLIIETRSRSVKSHPTADRWFTIGRAYLLAGGTSESADAFAEGLLLDPGRGAGWAGYSKALALSGKRDRAAAARRYSIRRAPHDPVSKRMRAE